MPYSFAFAERKNNNILSLSRRKKAFKKLGDCWCLNNVWYENFRTFCCSPYFSLNRQFNNSFCICHMMHKPNWNNSIIWKWRYFLPKSSKQIFSMKFSVAIKWIISCIKAAKYHKIGKENSKIYKECVIMRLALQCPPKSFMWFSLFTVSNFIISHQNCSYVNSSMLYLS